MSSDIFISILRNVILYAFVQISKNAMHINRCTKCAFESNHNATFDDENTQYASYSWFRISEFFIPDVDVIIYDSHLHNDINLNQTVFTSVA